jgi:epoxyqueuosine reductase
MSPGQDNGREATELVHRMEARGYACRMAQIGRLAEIGRDFETTRREGGLDETVAAERLGFFQFRPPDDFPGAASVIVVAVPLPQARLVFHWNGRRVPVSVPPAYIRFDDAGAAVREELTSILAPAGRRVAPALLPEKLLAARMGLAAYGRNNITYVAGMGSLLRLATFYTDVPVIEDHWKEPAMLPRCATCRSCARACPTTAITPDRFLLHTERCLVFHNERPGDIPFPGWIEPSWHGCLVGCMECHRACPENARLLDGARDEGEFTEEETAALLSGAQREQLPRELMLKLDRADLLGLFGILSRNLRAVLDSRAKKEPA